MRLRRPAATSNSRAPDISLGLAGQARQQRRDAMQMDGHLLHRGAVQRTGDAPVAHLVRSSRPDARLPAVDAGRLPAALVRIARTACRSSGVSPTPC